MQIILCDIESGSGNNLLQKIPIFSFITKYINAKNWYLLKTIPVLL